MQMILRPTSSPFFRINSFAFATLGLFCIFSGCTSSGSFNLWPDQFPLLTQTKEFAASRSLPTNLATENNKSVLPVYYIEPGDELLIEQLDLESETRLPGDQKVLVDGTIDLGAFGRLQVAGMTIESIETAIESQITSASEKREQINVRLLESNSAIIYVLGEVGSPGAYPLTGRETVLDGILKAGGLTSKASPCEIILSRPTDPCDCRVVLPICYRQIVQMGDTKTNYQLQPGDRIVVGSRGLFEELAFWKQRQSCERCGCSACSEPDARKADYRNRIFELPPPPSIPNLFRKPTKDSDKDTAENLDNRKLNVQRVSTRKTIIPENAMLGD